MPLCEKVKEHIKDTGFTSVSDYVTYILRELMSNSETNNSGDFTKEEEEKIKLRLRSLGYLD
ncbi:CopG family transcriptional regulator [Candidatus Micrarchaeota archaeon]|nr:CopG family transcriptional regulator [Candidatus Micrarchaeota archaeon]